MRLIILIITTAFALMSCSNDSNKADAFGTFEVDEVTISAKSAGELLEFRIEEGQQLTADSVVGVVDTTDLHLQRAELEAAVRGAAARQQAAEAQIKVAERELEQITRDHARISAMHEQKAATQKQLEDVTTGLELSRRKLDVLRTQFPAIAAERENIAAKGALLDQRLSNGIIINPVTGTVLTKYANQHELIVPGKPLYTIADLSSLYLKAFVSETQLSQIKLGNTVKVFTDVADGEMREHSGVITWISSKAEFTPKSVQTRDERVALVYAIKVRVRNSGNLQIGMPGEVRWN